MGLKKLERLHEAKTSQERVEAMKFSAEEITEAAKALASLYKPGNPIDRLLTRHIIPSGCYQQYKENGAEFLKKNLGARCRRNELCDRGVCSSPETSLSSNRFYWLLYT